MGTLSSEERDAPANASPELKPEKRRRTSARIGSLILMAVPAVVVLPPLLSWQRMGEQRALSLSNMRRVATGALLYSQDWDCRPTPLVQRVSGGGWQTWPRNLRPYVTPDAAFSNPSNPVDPFHSTVRDPMGLYPIDSSYAMNRRFWNTFARGPFPLESLELPEQTVLLVEAGPLWTDPLHAGADAGAAANGVLEYGDTLDRVAGKIPYPSTHDGRMAVVAADGHGLIVTVLHYKPADGPHDPLFGRIGASIYNWNGGHPNAETETPPRD